MGNTADTYVTHCTVKVAMKNLCMSRKGTWFGMVASHIAMHMVGHYTCLSSSFSIINSCETTFDQDSITRSLSNT